MLHYPAGWYVYCGSAFGPGGLAARMQRHLAGNGALHWHVDYLRRAARLDDWLWVEGQRLECAWSRRLVEAGGLVVAPHFGASDCQEGCPAHLLYFESIEGWGIARQSCVPAS